MIDCNVDEIDGERKKRHAKTLYAFVELVVALLIVTISILTCIALYGSPIDSMSPFQVILFSYTLILGILSLGWIICIFVRLTELVCRVDYDDV